MRYGKLVPVLVAALAAAACGAAGESAEGAEDRTWMQLPVPAEHQQGASIFATKCAVCHGLAASGGRGGPPLVHSIYEPNHHADFAFHAAVTQGVRAHHWRYGNMPPIPGVDREAVDQIIGYVRWLQREAGIY